MSNPKSAAAVITALKKEFEEESPEQILERVKALKAAAQVLPQHLRGAASLTLCLDYGTQRYGFAMSGAENLGDLKAIQGIVEHFQREVLGPRIRQLEVEAEVQRRLEKQLEESREPRESL